VEFDDGGWKTFPATYTACTSMPIRSELIETIHAISFKMSPLKGVAARNKGTALFPRRIDGKDAMNRPPTTRTSTSSIRTMWTSGTVAKPFEAEGAALAHQVPHIKHDIDPGSGRASADFGTRSKHSVLRRLKL
jgi:hypothetical protein